MRQKGLAPIAIILIVVIVAGIAVAAYNMVTPFTSAPVTTSVDESLPINISTTPPNTTKTNLIEIYNNFVQQGRATECKYFNDCFSDIFTPEAKLELAKKYNIANEVLSDQDIVIGLIKGSSADIPGIGTGYIANKEKIGLQPDSMYWEIGACSTDKRIFINASSGEVGILHTYAYCSSGPESF